jgi:hypothetical protein
MHVIPSFPVSLVARDHGRVNCLIGPGDAGKNTVL